MMLPRTLLARTFLLLALLVLLTTAAWLSLFRYIDAEPRARETAQLAASAVNLIRASLYAAAPEKRFGLFVDFSTHESIRLRPVEPGERIEKMPDTRFQRLLHQELAARLGERTRIAASVDDVPGFWVSFRFDEADEDEYWLVLPSERASRGVIAGHWLSWGLLAISLSLTVAWLIASRISRPLKALARSAQTVGRGQMPAPLPEEGPEELGRLAHAFNTMAADLQRHERDRSEVLAGISHDLRTPLTRLRLEAEMSVDEFARAGIIADIEQMEAVISQFMDYARAESGEPPEATDLATLLVGIVERQASIGRPLHADLGELPEGLPLRPKSIIRAVTNLIDNAWKYGGGNVTMTAAAVDGEIRIEISDRGPGIPEAESERMKRPFTRLEDARTNASGTGLGLAIVERIARLHDGRLELLANPGGGLLARLVLRKA